MFRKVRRIKRVIPDEAARELLKNERRGVLAVNGENGYPYAIPINFYFDEEAGKIYFHGAKVGYKSEAISACDKVCFTVYGNETFKDEAWAPYMQSTVVFGRCRKTNDIDEGFPRLRKLAGKYYPSADLIDEEISKDGLGVQVYEIEIEHLTGKQIKEK